MPAVSPAEYMAGTYVASFLPPSPGPLAFLLEAPGDKEVGRVQRGQPPEPAVGRTGWRHDKILAEVGLDPRRCPKLNVLGWQFPYWAGKNNNEQAVLNTKAEQQAALGDMEGIVARGLLPAKWRDALLRRAWQPIKGGNGYLPPELWPELVRCWEELETLGLPVVAYGGLAIWALSGRNGVKATRGHRTASDVVGLEFVGTYHPAATFRQESAVALVVQDVRKALEGPGVTTGATARPDDSFTIWVPEAPDELEWILKRVVDGRSPQSWDIETWFRAKAPADQERLGVLVRPEPTRPWLRTMDRAANGFHVDCIQVCAGPDDVVVVPFWDRQAPRGLWWQSEADHQAVMGSLRRRLEDPTTTKIGQNFSYDIEVLWTLCSIGVRGPIEDTMLLAHTLDLRPAKSLTELAAKWLDASFWKPDRRGAKTDD